MSAIIPTAPPQQWLQPVRYDLDAYRRFAYSLDDSLDRLVFQHKTRSVRFDAPKVSVAVSRQTAVLPHSDAPPKSESC